MLPVHNEDHVGRAEILAKVDEVEEGGLGEFFDGDIPKPNEELLWGLIIHAWESPACLSSSDADSWINLKVFHLVLV